MANIQLGIEKLDQPPKDYSQSYLSIIIGKLNRILDRLNTQIQKANANSGLSGQLSPGSIGSGSALLGANSPAIALTAPYTWITVTTSDGSTGYIPVWK